MKGLIKKDIFMLKNNTRYFLIFTLFYFLVSLNQTEPGSSTTFILPFLTMIMMISTFSYDEFNNWFSYAAALPNGRKNVVKSKYAITGITTVLSTLLSIFLAFIISNIKGNFSYSEMLSYLIGSVFACIFMTSIIYPFLFKYGSEKGRLVIFAISSMTVGAIVLLSKISNIKIPSRIVSILTDYGLLLLIIASVLMITISYFISKKIFTKKEF